MNVTVFTRHSADCPKKSDKHCKCSRIAGSLVRPPRHGHRRKPRKAKTMEPQPPKRQADQAGHDSAEPSKRKTIESAVEKFLKNKKADGIDQGTYYHSGFGHAQAVPRVGQSKSLVSLDEITLEDLEDFH